MLKGLLSLALVFVASSASACLQLQPNFAYKLSGKIALQENGTTYTGCEVKDGYLTMKNGEVFRLQSLVIECNERMLGHNSSFLTLKNGKVNPEQAGFNGTYDTHKVQVTYAQADVDGTYEEHDSILFAEKCDAVALDVTMKKTGKVNYDGHFLGQLTAKLLPQ